jgi:hypothetical protein
MDSCEVHKTLNHTHIYPFTQTVGVALHTHLFVIHISGLHSPLQILPVLVVTDLPTATSRSQSGSCGQVSHVQPRLAPLG